MAMVRVLVSAKWAGKVVDINRVNESLMRVMVLIGMKLVSGV